MKKLFLPLITLIAFLPALSACGKYDYSAHVSEARSDLFLAETEEFTLTLSCVSREKPYIADGVTCTKSDLVEITLTGSADADENGYSVYVLGEKEWGGEMSYRNTRGDYFYSQSVTAFPENNVSLRVEWGDERREITATTVKNGGTLSVGDALSAAVEAERETVKQMTENGEFRGEFYIRLLRRDKNYYYVGIIGKEGKTLSLLLDGENGKVLARRTGE